MPTLNQGSGVEIMQEREIAAATLPGAATYGVRMTHMVQCKYADAKIEGSKDAVMEITAIAGNLVTIGARIISTGAASADLGTDVNLPVQVIARGY